MKRKISRQTKVASNEGRSEKELEAAGSASGGKFDASLARQLRTAAMSVDVVGLIVSAKSSLKNCLRPSIEVTE